MLVLVVGAGVIGLAVARAAAMAGHEVIVAESTSGIGSGISSRNSEVIHAGMYYPPGSLRALHCVPGNRSLYAYCGSHGVAHRRCGKLIVATDAAELRQIGVIADRGRVNGVEGLELIDGAQARRLEPALSCVAALWSPQTGIVDGHGFMLALQGELEDHGGMIAFATRIERLTRRPHGWTAWFVGRDGTALDVDAIVNCGGLTAQRLAQATEGYPPERVPPLHFAKGNYFAYAGRPVFSRLIYPTPVDGGLGIHVTVDLAGRMRFGPDVEWIDEEAYEVDAGRAELFYARIRTYWAGLERERLLPDYSGIRPKLSGPGQPAADFVVDTPKDHGLFGLVQLFGIESPGLTCALSLAATVAATLSE